MGLKDRLRRALTDDPEATDDAVPAPGAGAHLAVLERLRDFVASRSDVPLDANAVDVHEDLYNGGAIDSQSAVELLAMIEEEYGVELSEVDLVGRLSTLDALARHVHERSHG